MITTLASTLGLFLASAICLAGPLVELQDRMRPPNAVPRSAALSSTTDQDLHGNNTTVEPEDLDATRVARKVVSVA
jgi:hypothetical protein